MNMKIIHGPSGREAKVIKGPGDLRPVYKCFAPGAKKNTDLNAVKFEKVEDAAAWLRETTGGGVRVAAKGKHSGEGTAILNKGLFIIHSDGRREML